MTVKIRTVTKSDSAEPAVTINTSKAKPTVLIMRKTVNTHHRLVFTSKHKKHFFNSQHKEYV